MKGQVVFPAVVGLTMSAVAMSACVVTVDVGQRCSVTREIGPDHSVKVRKQCGEVPPPQWRIAR